MSTNLGDLQREIAEISEQLGGLILQVGSIHSRLNQLEAASGGGRSSGGPGAASSEQSWSVVGEPSFSPPTGPVDKEDHPGRVALAKGIGQFFKRCVNGEARGSSGRDLLNLPNRLYVVLAGFSGEVFDQPKIFKDFSRVTAICKKGYSFGDSIFVGFATRWEAKAALEEAGLAWSDIQ